MAKRRAYKTIPNYHTRQDANAPQHRPLFTASVRVPTVGMIEAEGSSLKEATALVAEAAIAALKHSNHRGFKAFETVRIRAVERSAAEHWSEGAGLTSARRQVIRNCRQCLFGNGMLVDIFFLCVVHAHKGLYRLDDALCIAD
jgi:Double-stranded RNA binding motif